MQAANRSGAAQVRVAAWTAVASPATGGHGGNADVARVESIEVWLALAEVLCACVFGFGLGAGVAMALRGRRRAAQARRALARLGAPLATSALDALPEGATATIEGIYRSNAPLSTIAERGPAIGEDLDFYARTIGDEPARVEVGPVAIALDARRQVVVGARDGKEGKGAVRVVHDGDRVRVRGVIATEAGAESPHRSVRRRMSPEPDDAWTARPLPIVAALPTRPLRRMSAGIVGAGLAGAAAFGLPCAKAISANHGSPVATHIPSACAADLEERLEHTDPWALRAELAACPAPRTQGLAHFIVGDFADASDAFAWSTATPDLTECAAHVAAHRYARASAAIRAYAATREPEGGTAADQRAMALGCIADALDARAGDAAARARLQAVSTRRAMCRVLYADLLDGAARRWGTWFRGYCWAACRRSWWGTPSSTNPPRRRDSWARLFSW